MTFRQAPVAAIPVGAPAVPPAGRTQVWLDFDGTMTTSDLLDELVAGFSRNDSWKIIEERWRAGLIGSRDCLEQEFALLDISRRDLRTQLGRVALDPGAAALLALLERLAVPVVILSDGVESFIRAILRRSGVKAPAIRANGVEHAGGRLTLRPRHAGLNPPCRAAHCKCDSMCSLGRPGRRAVYVGDGLSDLCAARRADVVFAKGALAAALDREQRPFIQFSTLEDVRTTLLWGWAQPASQESVP
jgi:2-hydroxy-3-keto-5-methylthiopentenyl-1-phosphate phosphatase